MHIIGALVKTQIMVDSATIGATRGGIGGRLVPFESAPFESAQFTKIS